MLQCNQTADCYHADSSVKRKWKVTFWHICAYYRREQCDVRKRLWGVIFFQLCGFLGNFVFPQLIFNWPLHGFVRKTTTFLNEKNHVIEFQTLIFSLFVNKDSSYSRTNSARQKQHFFRHKRNNRNHNRISLGTSILPTWPTWINWTGWYKNILVLTL